MRAFFVFGRRWLLEHFSLPFVFATTKIEMLRADSTSFFCLMVVRQFFMIIQFRLAYLIKGECSEHSTNPKENQILFRSSMNKTGGVSSY